MIRTESFLRFLKPQPRRINLIVKHFLVHFMQSIQYTFLGRIMLGDHVLADQRGCDFSRAVAGSEEDGYSFVRIK